ncbi:MAG TPA: glycoside hydrolase family 127 protein [Panacibacter sp.]|nr:glycoside hydrolase family 127 protein [Panacibacter sp.]HNP43622.1 glycoside hydrolase family 127 protein [Panacibacter sp.]
MKKQTIFSTLIATAALSCALIARPQPDNNAFKKIKPVDEKLLPLAFGSVKPMGWIKQQLAENLNGFTGHLDSLAPDLIINDDIYGKDRLGKNIKSKDLGAIAEGGEWTVQYLWWNSETQSNWWDGYIRTAILLNDSAALKKVKVYISHILSTQDADGYLGIYDKDLRYHFNNENGELWSKTTLLRGLLAWYEYSRDKTVLTAITRAVDNVLANYPVNHSHPFYSDKPYAGGLTHGLMFTDVLEALYRLTGNHDYLDYCIFMYQDFSSFTLSEDAQYKKLLDTSLSFYGHGVHTYEHLRTVAAAYYASGNDSLALALKIFLYKISKYTLPSGAAAGDEFIGARTADATNTGYEFCSLHELMEGYISLLAKTGNALYGDKTERLFFNAAQGAMHPSQSAICYLKTDNSWSLTGGKNGDTSDIHQTRYRYSPVHKEAAVCCVPNAGRIGPAYVQNMWMKEQGALVATLLGPCELSTSLEGNNILIKETTGYPYTNTVSFNIKTGKPQTFTIKIRKPSWATKISSSAAYKIENNFIVITRQWNNNTVNLSFEASATIMHTAGNEIYLMYGPLVLAHPIEAKEKITRQYSVGGLKELQYSPVSDIRYQYNRSDLQLTRVKNTATPEFHVNMLEPESGKLTSLMLEPMGKTILRQVTFKLHE